LSGAISSVANRPASVITEATVSQSNSPSSYDSIISGRPATAFRENKMADTGERQAMKAFLRMGERPFAPA
jgi:hypothetical protein